MIIEKTNKNVVLIVKNKTKIRTTMLTLFPIVGRIGFCMRATHYLDSILVTTDKSKNISFDRTFILTCVTKIFHSKELV